MNRNDMKLEDNDFDFGFSIMSEDELDAVQRTQHEVSESHEQLNRLKGDLEKETTKAHRIFNMVMPLLHNLKANPNKEYIYWPTRVEKIDRFEEKLKDILEE